MSEQFWLGVGAAILLPPVLTAAWWVAAKVAKAGAEGIVGGSLRRQRRDYRPLYAAVVYGSSHAWALDLGPVSFGVSWCGSGGAERTRAAHRALTRLENEADGGDSQ